MALKRAQRSAQKGVSSSRDTPPPLGWPLLLLLLRVCL